jgi:hypothetical protein
VKESHLRRLTWLTKPDAQEGGFEEKNDENLSNDLRKEFGRENHVA